MHDMHQKEVPPVSLCGDLSHLLWSGIPLRPEVDLVFSLQRLAGDSRLIHARLVRPGIRAELNTRQDFELGQLGQEYTRLETPEAEMMVIAKHFVGISTRAEQTWIMVTVTLMNGNEQLFQLQAGIEGRWDWFVDPREMREGSVLHIPRPVGEIRQQAAA